MKDKNFTSENEDEEFILVDEDGNEISEEEAFGASVSEEDLGGEVELEDEYELDKSYLRDDDDIEDEDDEEEDDEDEEYSGSIANKMLVVFGAIIALVAIGIGVFLLAGKTNKHSTVDFSSVGVKVAEIGAVGSENIKAIAAAKGSYIDDINEAIKSYDYAEADMEGGVVTVNVSLTSILKDLKIKFTSKNDKLIAAVPFDVEVTGPDGKTVTWTDEDKDGIIYMTDLAGGSYNVKLVPMPGYESMYDFSQAGTKSISVKTQLDYQKVDVKNEVKVQNTANAAEDAVEKETVVESKLTDTVSYVMSAKTASSDGYVVVERSTVNNPLDALTKSYEASLGRFRRLDNEGDPEPAHTEHIPGTWVNNGNGKHTTTCTYEGCGEPLEEDHDFGTDGNAKECSKCGATNPNYVEPTPHEHVWSSWSIDESSKKHTRTCTSPECTTSGGYVETADCEIIPVKNDDGKTHTLKCKICEHVYGTEECKDEGTGTCECGRNMSKPALNVPTITLTAAASSIYVGADTTITATASVGADILPVKSWEWSMNDAASGEIVKVEAVANAPEKVKVTALKAGEATIKVAAKFDESSKQNPVEKTIKITVASSTVNILDGIGAKKALYIGGDTLTIKAEATGLTAEKKLIWTVADGNGSKVKLEFNKDNDSKYDATNKKETSTCKVTGLAEGNVEIVATIEGTSIKKSFTLVVKNHPKNDTSTKLLDKENNQLYVYDSGSKKYKEATYADYFSGASLYKPVAVTYKYTGWWTIDGKTYYFDANGKKVTGDQVILGAKYSFGSDGVLKSGTGLFGIDVSTFNGTIDWDKVAKSGVSYAIIRCGLRGSTEGKLYEDAKFATNIKNATNAGIKVGLYFFTQAISESEAVEEASLALSLAENYKVSYPIFLDVESATNGRANNLSKEARTNIISAFCKTITNGGYKAGVYANKTWFTNNIDTSKLTSYAIWLAQYAASPTYTATRYDVWQYTSEGKLNGISGNVDLDLSYLGY